MTLQFHPPVIGHRGACGYAPENTMASFIKAAQLNLKWVEFDVMESSDSVPVLFHDDYLHRTTNGRGLLCEHPYAYLQSLDAGKWFDTTFSGERIPSLISVIQFLREAHISANIEIKTLPGHEKKLVPLVIDQMQPYLQKGNDQYLFSSFSFEALRLLRQHSSDCQIGMLLHRWEKNWQELCEELNCVSVHVNEEILTPETAGKIKEMGKILLCYTVNDASRAQELFSWGVDAVFSDLPDRIFSIT